MAALLPTPTRAVLPGARAPAAPAVPLPLSIPGRAGPGLVRSQGALPVRLTHPRTRQGRPFSTYPPRAAENEAPAPPPPSSRHAPLHDFCMLIPYGFSLCGGGLVTLLLGAGAPALAAIAAGAACLALAAGSLAAWRAGRPSTPWSLASTAATAATAWWYWAAAPPGPGSSLAAGLSGAMAAFLAFNLLAGGNPSPRVRGGGGVEGASA